MESKFLSNMGLGSLDTGLVLFIAVIVLLIMTVVTIILALKLNNLQKRYEKF